MGRARAPLSSAMRRLSRSRWKQVMKKTSPYQDASKGVPRLLQVVAVASVGLGVIFTIHPFISIAPFKMAGRTLSHSELWATRVAFAVLLVGPLMVLLGIGTWRGRRWARPLLVVLPVLQTLPFLMVHWLFGAPSPVAGDFGWTIWIADSIIWALAGMAYLYGRPAARSHFA